jgi:LPXTG-site transpeptidase (sortase) family protein
MQALRFAAGVLLVFVGLGGLAMVAFGPREQVQLEVTRMVVRAEEIAGITIPAQPETAGEPVHAEPAPPPAGGPIAQVQIPSIRLASDVVPAQLVRAGQAQTWQVPAHKAGHAEGTAGAGGAGNAVLLGHVSSLNAGNVFKDLERVRAGDQVLLTAQDGRAVEYRVAEVRRVSRDDVSVVEDSSTPLVTLITCTGTWLPDAQDYSHRLVVRASLAA